MFSKLKQVKDLRRQAKTIQSTLAEEKVTITYKECSLTMDGNQKILSVSLDNKYLTPDQKEKLEHIVKELYEQATKKVQKIMIEKMKKQGDFKLPGL